MLRIPDQANGDYLGGVHKDTSDLNLLATVALGKEKKRKILPVNQHTLLKRTRYYLLKHVQHSRSLTGQFR